MSFFKYIIPIDAKDPQKAGYFESILSILGNILISVIKIFYGILSDSIALIADGVHSLSDVVTSVIVLVTAKISNKGFDKNHPFGHRRIDLISSIIIATLIFVVGLEFLKESILKFKDPNPIELDNIGLVLVISTIFIKEFMARLSIYLGKESNSPSLIAEGQHHRSDALSTIIVIIGIFASKFGFIYADAIAGILVSLFLFHVSYELIIESSTPLITANENPEIIKEIKEIIKKYDKVLGIHDIVVHNFGGVYNISFHIEIPDNMGLTEAHNLSDMIELDVKSKFPGHVVVHIDPINRDHPLYNAISNYIKNELSKKYPCLESAHDIRIVGNNRYFNLIFDLNLETEKRNEKILSDIINNIKNKFPTIKDISINIDLPF